MSKSTKNDSNDEERALRLNQFYRDLNKLVGYNLKYVNGRVLKTSIVSPLVSPNSVRISWSVDDVAAVTSQNAKHSTGNFWGNGKTAGTSRGTGDLPGNSKVSGAAAGTSQNAGKSAILSHDPRNKSLGYNSNYKD